MWIPIYQRNNKTKKEFMKERPIIYFASQVSDFLFGDEKKTPNRTLGYQRYITILGFLPFGSPRNGKHNVSWIHTVIIRGISEPRVQQTFSITVFPRITTLQFEIKYASIFGPCMWLKLNIAIYSQKCSKTII